MINKYIKYLLLAFMLGFVFSCSSAPEKPEPYWLQVANGFMGKGVMLYGQQKYSESTIEFTHALNAYQRFDYIEGLAESYLNLAKSAIAQNDISNASDYLLQLETLIEENNFSSMAALMDIMQSSIAINAGQHDQAVIILNKYLDLSGGNRTNIDENIYMALLTNRVKAAIALNHDERAWVNIFEEKASRNNFYQARLLRFKGQLAGLSKKPDMINQYFSRALGLYREQASPKAVLSTLKEWGNVLANNNQFKDAAKRLETAYKVAVSSANEFEVRNLLGSLLKVYKNTGDKENTKRINRLISE